MMRPCRGFLEKNLNDIVSNPSPLDKAPSFWISSSIVSILALSGLSIVSYYNFLLFHTLAELFSIVIAWAIFIIVWHTRDVNENNGLLFIGIVYLFVGFFDLFHTIAYKGMNILGGDGGANLSTQLWIAGRYMESIALLLYPRMMTQSIRPEKLMIFCLGITAVLMGSIFFLPFFPDCYIDGRGLTRFKIISEYVICSILFVALCLLYRHRRAMDSDLFKFISFSIILTIGAELAFTFYVSVYGLSNIIGHFLKIASFFFVYLALIRSALTKPYATLFKSLKKSEENLRQINQEMEQKIVERTRELEKIVNELELSNAELSQFSYVASHDLQEPLRAIVGFLQLLESRYTDQLDEKGLHYIERAVKAGHRMQRLINDLLTLSRVNSKGAPFEPADFNDILSKVKKDLSNQIKQKNAMIRWEHLPIMTVDQSQIATLFFNLISNGLKYNESVQPTVEVGFRRDTDETRFFVKDNGIGIEERFHDRIFIVFQRLHGRREYSGTGVGLTLCKKIVERHGGRIWLESSREKGSTFFFSLPNQRIEQ